jgi:hypothetical protein
MSLVVSVSVTVFVPPNMLVLVAPEKSQTQRNEVS